MLVVLEFMQMMVLVLEMKLSNMQMLTTMVNFMELKEQQVVFLNYIGIQAQ